MMFFQLNTCGYSPYVTSSLPRGWVCRLHLLMVLASSVILRSESRGTHDHILLSQIRDSPNLEGTVPVFISPINRVAQLYPQALGSLFVASYDSQGYSASMRPLLHMDRIENTVSNSTYLCCMHIRLHGSEFIEPLPRNDSVYLHISRSLLSNGCTRCSTF
jgi:hypothetical protein